MRSSIRCSCRWPVCMGSSVAMRKVTTSGRASRCGSQLPEIRGDALAQAFHGVLLEDKGCAFALHYQAGAETRGDYPLRLARLFPLRAGIRVARRRSCRRNKARRTRQVDCHRGFHAGRTVQLSHTCLFIGDDTTDLDGFAAMKRFNGLAIAVGSRIPGETRWRVRGCARLAESLGRLHDGFRK